MDEPVYVWFEHDEELPTPRSVALIQSLVDEADIVAAHNLKHDLNILRFFGVDFSGVKLHCTMVTDYLLTGQNTVDFRFNLDEVAERYGLSGKLDEVAALWDEGVDTRAIPKDLLTEYVLDDTLKVHHITPVQREKLGSLSPVYNLQMEFIHTLSDIEMNGFKWDGDKAQEIIAEYRSICDGYINALLKLGGEERLNLSSNDHLSALLYGGVAKISTYEWVVRELKVRPESYYYEKESVEEVVIDGLGFSPLPKTELKKKGYYSTDKGVIERLVCKTKAQREAKKLLLELSAHRKVLETLQGQQKHTGLVNKVFNGRIYPKLNQAITKTGRLSSSDPNSQNLPRGNTSPIKLCVVPEFDGIMQFDLSQIEWRAAAWLSQDATMIHEINSGIDQHAEACLNPDLMNIKFIGKHDPESKQNRNYAKFFNFRMIYGGSPYGFYYDHKMPSFPLKRWIQIVDGFYNKYWQLKEWQDRNIALVNQQQGYLTIPTGRMFHFPLTRQKDGSMGYDQRKIKNYPVQGISGGDILPLAGAIIRRGMVKHKFTSNIILTVHDSIVFDYVEAERDALARLCMRTVKKLPEYISNYFKIDWNVELDGEIEIGTSYGALNEIKIDY